MPNATHGGRLIKHQGRVASIAPGLLACVLVLIAPQTQAAEECGPDGPGADVVTCTGGTFANGITYTNSDGMTLVLEGGTSSTVAGSGGTAVLLQSDTTTTQDVTIIARQLGTVTMPFSGSVGILAANQGFGAATVVMDTGTLRGSVPVDRSASGIAASVGNAANSQDATTVLNGGLIELTGKFSAGVIAVNDGTGDAIIRVTGGTVRTTSETAPGVYAVTSQSSSTASIDIHITGGTITTSGNGDSFVATLPHAVYGLTGTLGDVTILLQDGEIITTGRRAYGVLSELSYLIGDINGGTNTMSATMTGGSIRTEGDESHGLAARTFLSTSAADARTRLDGGTITITGDDAAGVLASNWGSGFAEAVMTGGQITNSGTNGKGIYARVGEWASAQFARVALSGGTIDTSGDGGHGIHARSEIDASVEITMSGGAVTTTGAQAHGIFADRAINFRDEGIDVQITGGTVETSGTAAHGVYALNASTGTTRVLTATDITALGTGADAIRIDAREGTFDLDVVAGRVVGGPGMIGAPPSAPIQTIGAAGGTIDIHADAVVEGSGIYAIIDADGSTQMRIAGTLQDGIDAGAGDDSITFTASSRITLGQVVLGDGADTVTIEGGAALNNLLGIHGGGVSGDPDIWTDHLILQGSELNNGFPWTLTGWETLTIDGGGFIVPEFSGLTLGTGVDQGLFVRNGGEFVHRSGRTLAGNVHITSDSRYAGGGGPWPGLGGGYYYVNGTVRNDGLLTMADDRAGDQMFLRGDYAGGGVLALDVDFQSGLADTLSISGDVTAPGTVIDITDVSQGSANGADITLITVNGTSTEGDFRLSSGAVNAGAYSYQLAHTGNTWQLTPGISAAAGGYQSAGYVLGAFASGIDSNQGIASSLRFADVSAGGAPQARGAWVQASASRFEASSTGTAPITLSGSTQRLHFGFETLAETNGAGHWIFGLTGQIGTLSASTLNAGGSSKITADTIGIGATATWFGPGGLYLDTSAEVHHLSVDYTANGTSLATNETVMAYALNAELGQRIALTPAATLIPQVGLHFSHVGSQTFTDTGGNSIRIDNQDRLIGRLGVAYEVRPRQGTTVYAKGSLLHDFSAESGATVSGTALTGAFDDTWAEVAVGASHTWDTNRTAFADINYRRGIDGDGSAVSLNAGFKLTW